MQQKNTYILGMGSNHQAEQNLLYARQELTERYPDIKFSTVQRTTPIGDRKSTRLNSSHDQISYAVFCLKK